LCVSLYYTHGELEPNMESEIETIEEKISEESQLYIEDEDYLEAVEILKDGIKEIHSMTKRPTVHSARLLHRMGEVWTLAGKKDEAIGTMARVVKTYNKLFGPQSESTYNMLVSLADTYMRFSAWEEAIPLFERLAKYEKRKYGKKSARYIRMFANLGKTYMSAGMPKRDDEKDENKQPPVLKWLKKASKTFKKVLILLEQTQEEDESSGKMLKIFMRLIRTEMLTGKMESAFDYLERARELAISEYGKESMEFVETLNALGTLQEMVGAADEGIQTFKEALSITEELFDEDSVEVKKARSNLEGIERHIGVKNAAKEAKIPLEKLNEGGMYDPLKLEL